jgi:Putative adhesin
VSGSSMQGWHRAGCRAIFAMLMVAAAILSVAPAGFGISQVYEEKYPLSRGGSFELVNVNGSVQVDGWDRDEVEVRAVKTTTGDERDLSSVQIEVDSARNHVAVHTRYPQGTGVDVAVEYHVLVPYRVLLGGVETVNGNVRVRGIEGRGELRTVNGDVDISDSAGRFSAHTTNGSISLKLRKLSDDGPMALETVNGCVVLGLPHDAHAELNAVSLNGDVSSQLPVTTTSAQAGRGVSGVLGGGGNRISLRTVNGGIRVVLAEPGV